jgi:hypothetical protein
MSIEADVVDALLELQRRQPGVRQAVIKLNESFSGEGNAVCTIPAVPQKEAVQRALETLEFAVPTETPERYFSKLSAMGGVVEEFLVGRYKASPSAQLRTSPDGSVLLISTHAQILGGRSDQACRLHLPGPRRLSAAHSELALRVGRVLADHGVVSRFGVDFLATRDTRRERGA